MPVASIPQGVASPDSNVYDISQVSGFYGPGAWAAWIIALASSCIRLLTGERDLNYDNLAHLLYTNWAAVDLLRLLRNDPPAVGPMSAAVAVCFLGIVLAYVHFVHMAFRSWDSGLAATGLGTILPFYALMGFSSKSWKNQDLFWDKIDGSTDADWMTVQFVVAVLAGSFCIPVALVIIRLKAFKDARARVDRFDRCFGTTFVVWYAFQIGYIGVIYGTMAIGSRQPDCYLLKPCTTQSISDWDQAFALLCALVFVVWEMGPLVQNIVTQRRDAHSN